MSTLFPDAVSVAPGVFLFLLATQCASTVIAAISLVQRGRKFPFKGRELSLLWGLLIGTSFSGLGSSIETLWTVRDCVYHVLTGSVTVLLSLNAVAVRLLRLWFLYFAAHEKLDRKYHRSNSTWFEDRRHWVSTRYLFGTYASITLIESLCMLTPYFAGSGWRDQMGGIGSDECGIGAVRPIILVFQCSVIFVYAWTGWKIRGIKDGFHIKDEMKYAACVALLTTVVTPFFHETLGTGFRIFRFFVVVFTQMIQAVFFHYPLYLSLRFDHEQKRALRSAERTQQSRVAESATLKSTPQTPLREVLTEERYVQDRSHFEAHLCKEFSLENLLFWDRVNTFLALGESETTSYEVLVREALDVYMTFVRSGAPQETNLDAKSTRAITAELRTAIVNFRAVVSKPGTKLELASGSHISDTLFDRAQTNIYRLMSTDSYVRWHHDRRVERDRLARQEQRRDSEPANENDSLISHDDDGDDDDGDGDGDSVKHRESRHRKGSGVCIELTV